jgi:uncharacterized phage-associated protein
MTCQEVADYFLAQMDAEAGDTISNLELQKLVYYAQGFHLALFDKPLFDEPIYKWLHGPVVPELYQAYQKYEGALPSPHGLDLAKYPAEVRELLDEVYAEYGQYSAWKLRDLTQAEPLWAETEINAPYTLGKMRDYFKTRLHHEEAA